MIDLEAAAKAAYKDYEGCSDEYVEKVWAWAIMEHNRLCDTYGAEACGKCSFEETVKDFIATAQLTINAALGDTVLYREVVTMENHGSLPGVTASIPRTEYIRVWPEATKENQ